MTDPITVVLADEQHLVRQAIRHLLDSQPDMRVVAELTNGLEVPEQVARLKPSILLVRAVLSGLGGVEIARRVRNRTPRTRVVVLAAVGLEGRVGESIRNGASGFVSLAATADDLVQGLRTVHEGGRYVSPPMSEGDWEALERAGAAGNHDPYERLTTREREVFHLAAEGFGNVEIAPRLGISPRTVETHRARIMRKLSLTRPSDLVRYAIRRGILRVDPEE
jgi:two-component system response regulator NreC